MKKFKYLFLIVLAFIVITGVYLSIDNSAIKDVKSENLKAIKEEKGIYVENSDFKYDIKMLAWGTATNGRNIGCFLSEDESYAKTFYIKIHKQEYKDKIVQLLKDVKWQEIYPMTAVPNLLQWQVYKYIEDNFSI